MHLARQGLRRRGLSSYGKRGRRIDPPGFDGGKKIKEKKRHVLVHTQGLLMHAIVHAPISRIAMARFW